MGLSDDGLGNAVLSTVGGYWVVTGKIFLWLDTADSSTSGPTPTISNVDPQFFVTSTVGNSGNTTLNYQVLAQRQFAVSNTITTSIGKQQVSWSQTLSYSNVADFVAGGMNQTNNLMISGMEKSSSGYSRKFAFPLYVFQSAVVDRDAGTMALVGRLDRSKNVQVIGNPVFPSPLDAFADQGPFDGWTITNRQNGSAFYFLHGSQSGSNGVTEQDFVLKGIINSDSKASQAPMGGNGNQLFTRHVLAANNSVIYDSGTAGTAGTGPTRGPTTAPDDLNLEMSEFAIIPLNNVVGGKVIQRPGTL
jgi:hypothetical protein